MINSEKKEIEMIDERTQFIIEQFERIHLDIRDYPDLFERLKHLNSPESTHFKDSVQIVEIIDVIWNDLEERLPFKIDKEKLFLATLLHDIGKSGPCDATSREQTLIVSLFNPRYYGSILNAGKRVEQLPLIEALYQSSMGLELQKEIVDYLKKIGVNLETEKMIDFWRRHVDWTFEILAQNQRGKITSEIVTTAASHHILDGKNPAHLDLDSIPYEAKTMEIIETYEVLTLIDKFQAFVQRSGLSHEEAVDILRKIIDRQNMSEKNKDDYRAILSVIERSKDKLQNILKMRL